jgi:hypothetical protein
VDHDRAAAEIDLGKDVDLLACRNWISGKAPLKCRDGVIDSFAGSIMELLSLVKTVLLAGVIAVGTTLRLFVSGRPPHRSERAALPHSAPTLGSISKAVPGIRMKHTRCWKPSSSQPAQSFPSDRRALTTTP